MAADGSSKAMAATGREVTVGEEEEDGRRGELPQGRRRMACLADRSAGVREEEHSPRGALLLARVWGWLLNE